MALFFFIWYLGSSQNKMANENNFFYLQSAWLAQTIYHSTSVNFVLIGDKKKDWQTVELVEIKWSFIHPLD